MTIRVEKLKDMPEHRKLEQSGYLVCEFGDSCERCGKEFPEGELFWICTGYPEYPHEGRYICKGCALKEIQAFEEGEEE
jgi:hypothetical protein